ncbi:sigma-70 family RNA polymerase sigma factor, partial [Xanthomonas citri pv. citri]|nr:sigma-70 family RNA polymerase sigma factor [Xanthomonas citri pv. citri]
MSDVALVDAYREGNADAFGVLFERYKDKMWAVALRTTRDQELAADAVQEGFIAAFRRIDSFRGDAQFSTWLHRIIVNSSLDRLRRLKP